MIYHSFLKSWQQIKHFQAFSRYSAPILLANFGQLRKDSFQQASSSWNGHQKEKQISSVRIYNMKPKSFHSWWWWFSLNRGQCETEIVSFLMMMVFFELRPGFIHNRPERIEFSDQFPIITVSFRRIVDCNVIIFK